MNWRQDLKIWLIILFVGLATYCLALYVKNSDAFVWAGIKGIELQPIADQNGLSTLAETGQKVVEPTPTVIEETVAPTPTMLLPTPQLSAPMTVLLVGDSMMLEGFGPRMESKLAEYKDVKIKRFGKYSTGLNRVDYYDWYKRTQELIAAEKPNILIVQFGGNDGQSILNYSNGKKVSQASAEWDMLYSARVNSYLTQFTPQVREFYWVGHPIPRTDEFYRKFSRMNTIYVAECAKFPNCHYVDEWSRFAVNGKYSATLADDKGLTKTVKGADGIHVNTHGGNIMADLVIKIIKQDVILEHK
jgi:hypothetical protein